MKSSTSLRLILWIPCNASEIFLCVATHILHKILFIPEHKRKKNSWGKLLHATKTQDIENIRRKSLGKKNKREKVKFAMLVIYKNGFCNVWSIPKVPNVISKSRNVFLGKIVGIYLSYNVTHDFLCLSIITTQQHTYMCAWIVQ